MISLSYDLDDKSRLLRHIRRLGVQCVGLSILDIELTSILWL